MNVRELVEELSKLPPEADVDLEVFADTEPGSALEAVHVAGCESVRMDTDGTVVLSQEAGRRT